jgi:predicted amidophosphoribosyltransferase
VRALKFRAIRPLGAVLGGLAADAFEHRVRLPRSAVVVPVPGHPARTSARGVDHTRLLADAVGARLGLAVRAELLRRAPDSALTARPHRQVGLDAAARRANLATAFVAGGVPPDAVVLVDDVFTTGATAAAASSVIRRSGGLVFVCVVARSDRVPREAAFIGRDPRGRAE